MMRGGFDILEVFVERLQIINKNVFFLCFYLVSVC